MKKSLQTAGIITFLIIVAVAAIALRHHNDQPATRITTNHTTSMAPQATDTRSQQQWELDCHPAWGENTQTGTTGVFCTTPNNSSFDKDSGLPAGWKWISKPFYDF